MRRPHHGWDPAFELHFTASLARAQTTVPASLPPCHDCRTRDFWQLAMTGDRYTCQCRGLHTYHDGVHGVRVR